mmetsp:Transcript_7967/g.15536  ORF Transcript_7967/g.15536 Transcript_7967/m.15536 type:complete len:207 (-) Transcript_7967:340-960(-)
MITPICFTSHESTRRARRNGNAPSRNARHNAENPESHSLLWDRQRVSIRRGFAALSLNEAQRTFMPSLPSAVSSRLRVRRPDSLPVRTASASAETASVPNLLPLRLRVSSDCDRIGNTAHASFVCRLPAENVSALRRGQSKFRSPPCVPSDEDRVRKRHRRGRAGPLTACAPSVKSSTDAGRDSSKRKILEWETPSSISGMEKASR